MDRNNLLTAVIKQKRETNVPPF